MAKHHASRIRWIHARYLVALALVGLTLAGVAMRSQSEQQVMQVRSDTAVLNAVMDSGSADTVLLPPEVLGGR